MLKLARWSTTHRKYVVLGWIVLLIGVNALAQSAGTSYSNNFSLPNSDAQRAGDLLERSFPSQSGDRDFVVFRATNGSVLDPSVRTRMTSMFARLAHAPHVADVISPYSDGAQASSISKDRRIAFATIVFDKKINLLTKDSAKPAIAIARAAAGPGLQVELGGQAIEMTQQQGFAAATAIGLLAAIVVLLLTFGSLIAMGLPILTALLGLGTGLGVIALGTHVVDTPDFSSELAAMIGLGVGIDYALFILTRFREAHALTGDVKESVVQAMDTAGRAVLFAGVTVVIALLGMMLLGVSFLYGVAVSAAVGVLLVMLASLTLLPALLATFGARVARPSRRARRRQAKQATAGHNGGAQTAATHAPVTVAAQASGATGGGAWLRWSEFVQRHPWPIALVSGLLMLAIAAPTTALRLGSSDAGNDAPGLTTHRAYGLLADGFGKGSNGPLLIVAQPARRGDLAGLRRVQAAIAATPDVVSVTPPRLNAAGDVATISAYPRSSPQEYATTQLVAHLRDDVIPPIAAQTQTQVYVGGFSAGGIDFADTLGAKLPLFIGVVVLLSALLLMIVFRSLVIPLQAAIMNLLSISASLGVIVAIFQWGWLSGLMGVSQGPIEAFIPVMLFAIVFGLSMDYEVFLISRMHERWVHTGSASRAVGEGLALTGRVITAAAAIMVCVFLSFMFGDDRVIKEFGLSLASAVFIDALVVRCLLLPAVLNLLGRASWWLPASLERIIPRLNIEGSGLSALPAADSGAGHAAAGAHRPRSGVAAEGAEG
ncbi:MAG TPA: MMPL family transporter [Solirubrobacteraceae bacterium]|nr:MMPL family transporter [Solirubrobacteraceae bacterium]